MLGARRVGIQGVAVVVVGAPVQSAQLGVHVGCLAAHHLLHVDVRSRIGGVEGQLGIGGQVLLLVGLLGVVVGVELGAVGVFRIGHRAQAVIEVAVGIHRVLGHGRLGLHAHAHEGIAVAHVQALQIRVGGRRSAQQRGLHGLGGARHRRVHILALVTLLARAHAGSLGLGHVLGAHQHVLHAVVARLGLGVHIAALVERLAGGLVPGAVLVLDDRSGHLLGALVVLGQHQLAGIGAGTVAVAGVQVGLGLIQLASQKRQREGLLQRPLHLAVVAVALQGEGDDVAVLHALGVGLHRSVGVALDHLGGDDAVVVALHHLDALVAVGVAQHAVGEHDVALPPGARRGDDRAVHRQDGALARTQARGRGAGNAVGGVVHRRGGVARTVARVGLHLVAHVQRGHLGAQLHRGVHAGIVVGGHGVGAAVLELLAVGGGRVGHQVAVAVHVAMAVQAVGGGAGQAVGVGGEVVVAHREALALGQRRGQGLAGGVLGHRVGAHERQARHHQAAQGVGHADGAVALGIGAVEAGKVVVGHLLGHVRAGLRVAHLDVLGRDEALGMGRGRVLAARGVLSCVGVVGALSGIEALVGLVVAGGLGDVVVGGGVHRGPVGVVGSVGQPSQLLVAGQLGLGAHGERVVGVGGRQGGVARQHAGGLRDAVGRAGIGHLDALVGEELRAVRLGGDEGADVLVALGHGSRVQAHLRLVVGEHVELEGVKAARDDLGHQVASVVVAGGLGLEAQHVAPLGRTRVGGHGLEGVGDVPVGVLPVGGHVVVHACQLLVAGVGGVAGIGRGGVQALVLVGIGAHHVGHIPVLGGNLPGVGAGPLVLALDGIGLARGLGVRRHTVGQHHGQHGQGERALGAAVHGVVVVVLGVVGGAVVHVGRVVVLPLVGLVVQPVAVLDVHVDLTTVGLGVHIVGLVDGLHGIGGLAGLSHIIAHGVPHAHERLAHHGVGARGRVERLGGALGAVGGNGPLQGVVVVARGGVGHLQAHGGQRPGLVVSGQIGVGGHGVHHGGGAVHGREVRRAVELAVQRRVHAVAVAGNERPAVVHTVGLHVLAAAAQARVALVHVHVVNLVVGARVEGLLIRNARRGRGGLLVEGAAGSDLVGRGRSIGAVGVVLHEQGHAGLGRLAGGQGHLLVGVLHRGLARGGAVQGGLDMVGVVPRGREQAVVPGLVLVVAEDVACQVHPQLVAAGGVALGHGGRVMDTGSRSVPLAALSTARPNHLPKSCFTVIFSTQGWELWV